MGHLLRMGCLLHVLKGLCPYFTHTRNNHRTHEPRCGLYKWDIDTIVSRVVGHAAQAANNINKSCAFKAEHIHNNNDGSSIAHQPHSIRGGVQSSLTVELIQTN